MLHFISNKSIFNLFTHAVHISNILCMDGITKIRLASFFITIVVVLIIERILPKISLKSDSIGIVWRWIGNYSLIIISNILIYFIFPWKLMELALEVTYKGKGLFPALNLDANKWITIVLTVLILDLVIYAQHICFHKLNIFWKFHKVHHSETFLDATSGFRFHPVEMIISLIIKAITIVLLGASPLGVLLFEIILNSSSIFNHGNIKLPNWLNKILRLIVVTPDFHRVHHLEKSNHMNSNYGFCFPWWDIIFKTKTYSSDMNIGIKSSITSGFNGILLLFTIPFKK